MAEGASVIDPEAFTLITDPRVRIGPHDRKRVYEALLYGKEHRRAHQVLPLQPLSDPLRTAWEGYGSVTGSQYVLGFDRPILTETRYALIESLDSRVANEHTHVQDEIRSAMEIIDYALGLIVEAEG